MGYLVVAIFIGAFLLSHFGTIIKLSLGMIGLGVLASFMSCQKSK